MSAGAIVKKRLSAYVEATTSPVTAAALALPLLVIYGLGTILIPEARNGVDLVSSLLAWTFRVLGAGTAAPVAAYYASFYGLLAAANVGLVVYLRKKGRFEGRVFLPLIFESAFYAVVVGTVSSALTNQLLNAVPLATSVVPLVAGESMGPVTGVFVSAGAGLHEEFVFRLIGIGAVARLWLGVQWRSQLGKLLVIVVVSSLLFSAVHHVVEPFGLQVFTFRTFAGLVFSALYLLRGFAVAAWTHALYDVWVIVVLGA
jgi:hypothetical protein